jgi:putative FmdB family regulatory protein
MPIYEYCCAKCGKMEIPQKITENPRKNCPYCGNDVKKLVSKSDFVLKGKGWPGKEIKKNTK